MNKKVYIGIGMLVSGVIAAVVLFQIFPLLMGIGHILTVAGLITMGRGLAQNKKTSQPSSGGAGGVVKPSLCSCCGKTLAHGIFWINGAKYCADCKAAMEQNHKNQHSVCSVCGVELPIEHMHTINNALICHTCFLAQLGHLDFGDDYAVTTVGDYAPVLNNRLDSVSEDDRTACAADVEVK